MEHRDALLEARHAFADRDPESLELLGTPTESESDDQSPARDEVDDRCVLRDPDRFVQGASRSPVPTSIWLVLAAIAAHIGRSDGK
jgi:hypothetical protein